MNRIPCKILTESKNYLAYAKKIQKNAPMTNIHLSERSNLQANKSGWNDNVAESCI